MRLFLLIGLAVVFMGCKSDKVRIVEADDVSDKILTSCGMDRSDLLFIQTGHIKFWQAMMIYGSSLGFPEENTLRALSKSADNIPYQNLTINPEKGDTEAFVLTFEPKIKCPIALISSSLTLEATSKVTLTKLTFQIE